MPGRHSQARPEVLEHDGSGHGRAVVAGVLAVALLAGVGYGGYSYLQGRGDTATAACTGSLTLRVTAATDIAPTVTQLAQSFIKTQPVAQGRCVQIDVKAEAAAATAGALSASKGIIPNLWIPDSSLWAQSVQQQVAATPAAAAADVNATPQAKLQISSSIASSPLVVVLPRDKANALGWPASTFSWAQVLQGQLPSVLPDPSTTSEGLTAAITLNKVFGGSSAAKEQLTNALLKAARSTPVDVTTAYAAVSADPATAAAFPASEHSVIAHNKADAPHAVAALYPSDGTYNFDYPVVQIETSGTPTSLDAIATRFERSLRTTDSQNALQQAGFRTPDGVAKGFGDDLGVVADKPNLLGEMRLADATTLLRTLAALRLDSRMLAVIDVSGSMRTATPQGTRIELARDAALKALTLFPASSEVGLWAFSIDQNPPLDYKELAATAPLTPQHLAELKAAANELPGLAKGGTGLYDTVLAAYRTAKDGYKPGRVNSVVILTDGQNEDENGISLDALTNTLRSEADPARPVVLIPIAIGDEPDMATLQSIASLTGGRAYAARNPADIQSVFLSAMADRAQR